MTHSTDAKNPDLATASTSQTSEARRADLPLSCPTPEQRLRNAHPRVFLPIEKTGEAPCPYCSTHHRLVD